MCFWMWCWDVPSDVVMTTLASAETLRWRGDVHPLAFKILRKVAEILAFLGYFLEKAAL